MELGRENNLGRSKLKAAALQFRLHHPGVTSVIPGTSSAAGLNEHLRMLRGPVPAERWREFKAAVWMDTQAPTP